MNADGSGVRQLTANTLDDELPSWSPDGRKLAFQRDFDPVVGEMDYDILTMHADGTRQRNLTRSPGIQDFDADWSPDGRKITSRPTATRTSRSTRCAPTGAGRSTEPGTRRSTLTLTGCHSRNGTTEGRWR